MLKMYQHVMLGETNAKVFADVSFKEGLALVSIMLFFWDVSKPITDLITPSLENILTQQN
jgi:NADH-quinone oxidoreductase subunit M